MFLSHSDRIRPEYAMLKYLYRTGDTRFNKRPNVALVYATEKYTGLTRVSSLKKYQINLLKSALKLSLERKDIDNLEYIEALNIIKEFNKINLNNQIDNSNKKRCKSKKILVQLLTQ